MADLNDDKEAFVLSCTERALNTWLMYLLAEEMKTYKRTVHSVEVTHCSFFTFSPLCACCLKKFISLLQ